MARVILRSRSPVPPSIAALAGEALQHRFILRDVKQSAWRRRGFFSQNCAFCASCVSVLNFSLETVIDGSAMGVDRKLRGLALGNFFPKKFLLVVRQRSRAGRLQSLSICTSRIELKKMFSLNTFFYLSSVGDRAAMRGSTLTAVLNDNRLDVRDQ